MKSLAVIGTPSDQTAFGFRVYTIVWGLVRTTSACSIRFGFCIVGVCAPAWLTTYGLGSTAPSTIWVPGVSPVGVLALQPVGPAVIPKEMDPPATATYVTVVLVEAAPAVPPAAVRTVRAAPHAVRIRRHPGRCPGCVT